MKKEKQDIVTDLATMFVVSAAKVAILFIIFGLFFFLIR